MQILPEAPQTVHVTSKCARSLFLLVPGDAMAGAGAGGGGSGSPGERGERGEHPDLRKELMMERLETLQDATSIVVIGLSLMDNHVHLILKNEAAVALQWPAEEVIRRWITLHPKRDFRSQAVETTEKEFAEMVADDALVAKRRRQLADVSEFMKDFKQRVAQQINRLEGVKGRFWDGTFKSKLIEDEEQLVATMIYVDLNPLAAGVCTTPEAGRYTSLAGRLEMDLPLQDREAVEVEATAEAADREHGADDAPSGPRIPRRRGCGAWLRPMDESGEAQHRRGQRPLADGEAVRAASAGTVAVGLSLRVYLRLIDAVSRKLRAGNHRLRAGTRSLFERMGLDADAVSGRVLALRAAGERLGLGHATPRPLAASAR